MDEEKQKKCRKLRLELFMYAGKATVIDICYYIPLDISCKNCTNKLDLFEKGLNIDGYYRNHLKIVGIIVIRTNKQRK